MQWKWSRWKEWTPLPVGQRQHKLSQFRHPQWHGMISQRTWCLVLLRFLQKTVLQSTYWPQMLLSHTSQATQIWFNHIQIKTIWSAWGSIQIDHNSVKGQQVINFSTVLFVTKLYISYALGGGGEKTIFPAYVFMNDRENYSYLSIYFLQTMVVHWMHALISPREENMHLTLKCAQFWIIFSPKRNCT